VSDFTRTFLGFWAFMLRWFLFTLPVAWLIGSTEERMTAAMIIGAVPALLWPQISQRLGLGRRRPDVS
jgi:hypothetical protein